MSFRIRFQNVDQHTGRKWFNDITNSIFDIAISISDISK